MVELESTPAFLNGLGILRFFLGYYYTTSFSSGLDFGYQNLQGPQIYPAIQRFFRKGDSLSFYFKFSPVANNFNLLAISNREIATGFTYAYPLNSNHLATLSFDLANIQINQSATFIQTNSYSLSAGYSF